MPHLLYFNVIKIVALVLLFAALARLLRPEVALEDDDEELAIRRGRHFSEELDAPNLPALHIEDRAKVRHSKCLGLDTWLEVIGPNVIADAILSGNWRYALLTDQIRLIDAVGSRFVPRVLHGVIFALLQWLEQIARCFEIITLTSWPGYLG